MSDDSREYIFSSSILFMILRFLFSSLFTELTGHTMVRNSKFRWENGMDIIFHEKLANEMDAGEQNKSWDLWSANEVKWKKNSFAFCNVKCF